MLKKKNSKTVFFGKKLSFETKKIFLKNKIFFGKKLFSTSGA